MDTDSGKYFIGIAREHKRGVIFERTASNGYERHDIMTCEGGGGYGMGR